MPLTSTALDQTLQVRCDADLVRSALLRIRDAHAEVSLADLVIDDETLINQERRRSYRTQLQVPVLVTPVDWSTDVEDAVVVRGEEQIGVTRDLSPTGMGLTHDQLLGSEAAIVQFDIPGEGPLHLVVDLRWVVRKSQFSYLSGGRAAGLIESAPADNIA